MKEDDRLKLPTEEETISLLVNLYYDFDDYKEELTEKKDFDGKSFVRIVRLCEETIYSFQKLLTLTTYRQIKKEFNPDLIKMKITLDEARKKLPKKRRPQHES